MKYNITVRKIAQSYKDYGVEAETESEAETQALIWALNDDEPWIDEDILAVERVTASE